VIVDLGCGEAALAKALIPKGLTVLSYDLISNEPFVIEADICSKIPLPGGEEEAVGQVVDVCVCSLSLMNTNWIFSLREAHRVLKQTGILKIAEVSSRLSDKKAFEKLVKSIGFQMVTKDVSNTHFIKFEFRKTTRSWNSEHEWSRLHEQSGVLKPCDYKRR